MRRLLAICDNMNEWTNNEWHVDKMCQSNGSAEECYIATNKGKYIKCVM